jgi:putative oxidoreductase
MRRKIPMILIRVIVGLVFLTEGILKFLEPDQLGAGRFSAIGLPFPQYLGPFVGGVEIFGGAAILVNLYAGDAALLLLLVILTALITTKLPILIGGPVGPFPVQQLPRYGFLIFLHEARVELCMIFGSLAVLFDSGLQFMRRRQWWQSGDD